MTTYYLDANVLLRFLLQDNKSLARQAESYLTKAKKGQIQLIITPQVIFEINYVLQKVYELKKSQIIDYLSVLVKTPYLQVESRQVLINSLKTYTQTNINLVDIYLFHLAKSQNAQVLSFDKHFVKLTCSEFKQF